MTISGLVLPAIAALAVGVPAAGPHRRLHPSVGARALALATAALTLAVTAAVATLAVGFLSAIPWVREHLTWCNSLYRTHDQIPAWTGVPATVALGAMIVVGTRAYRQARLGLWAAAEPGPQIRIVGDNRPDAYAIGGRCGHIVVSTGMLAALDGAERRVLLAHERSHLRHRHHRYIALALVSKASVPILGFLTGRLRLAVERWADEDAAAEVGDRRLVARAIVRAALAKSDYPTGPALLGLGHLGVRARVDALLLPAPALGSGFSSALLSAPFLGVAVVAGSTLQVHHLWSFASHVCGL